MPSKAVEFFEIISCDLSTLKHLWLFKIWYISLHEDESTSTKNNVLHKLSIVSSSRHLNISSSCPSVSTFIKSGTPYLEIICFSVEILTIAVSWLGS